MSPLDIAFHLLKNNKFHPEDEPMSSDDMISYLDEEYLGHIGSKEAEPMEIYQDVMADTPEGRKKQTNIMGTTYDGKPTFNMIPLAGEGQPMVNPHAEIFRRSEPLEIAMQLLKNEWDYVDDNVLPENDLHYIYPNEQMWNDEADDDLKEKKQMHFGNILNLCTHKTN